MWAVRQPQLLAQVLASAVSSGLGCMLYELYACMVYELYGCMGPAGAAGQGE